MVSFEERKLKSGKKVYRVRVRLKESCVERATCDRLTDAKKWAVSTESAIREGRHFKTSEAKRHTLGEMIDRYLKDVLPHKGNSMQRDQWTQLEWWKMEIGDQLLADVSPSLIKEAKLNDFRFHDLHHSAASYLAMSGASLVEIVEVFGHKTLQMVKRYSHLSEQHTVSVVEKMNTKIFGGG